MVALYLREPEYLMTLKDGTVKQLNPFSGTEVWTVAGRGNRPITVPHLDPAPIDVEQHGRYCAFCEHRYLDTPPEKARVVRDGDRWETRYRTPAEELAANVAEAMDGPSATTTGADPGETADGTGLAGTGTGAHGLNEATEAAEFRRIPNLFEILSYDYWHANYGYELPEPVQEHADAYLASPAGHAHVRRVVAAKLRAMGRTQADVDALDDAELKTFARSFFGGGHDVIVARRHYTDGATDTTQLASSGTLTPEEHYRFIAFTAESARDLFEVNRYARYVAVFQNWLGPAGASFDHLHKQLAAIDERGVQHELAHQRLRENPNVYNDDAANYAAYANLIIAENEHALAFAGFGHRYPTIEIYSKSEACDPWDHRPEELRDVSDLIHAMHAATGPHVPCNEEWHYRPIDFDVPMPWRVMLKWRISTLAGFEGATKIYLNTIDPYTVRDRVVSALFDLRDAGKIAHLRLATECECRPNPLRYRANRVGQ